MERVKFKRHLGEALLVPLLALVGLGLFYVVLLHFDYRAHQQLNRIDTIVTSAEQIQDLLADQRATVRRFEIAPADAPVSGLPALRDQTQTALANLRKFAAADPVATSLLMQLGEQYHQWLDWTQSTLNGNTSHLTLAQRDKHGVALINAARATTRRLLTHEHHRRDRQALHISRFKRHTIEAISISALLIGLLLATFTRKSLNTVSRSYRSVIDELNRSSEELERSRNWFQTTLESIGDAVLTCNRQGSITFMNSVAENLTGWSADEALGHSSIKIFHILDEESRKPLESPISRVALSSTIQSLSGQCLLVARDKSECLIQHNVASIRNKKGQTTGAVLVFRDVTSEIRTRQALQTSEKLAVAGRLAASIAHEIHNPLDSIANLHYLIDAEEDPETKREHLALARQELARIIQITRTMLSLYRESDAPVITSLADLTRGVLLLLDHRIHDHAMKIYEVYKGNCTVEGFPAELRQVLTNVLVNAMDAAGQQGRVRVHIEEQPPQEFRPRGVLIQITDSGKGISDDAGQHIFRPFFTTKGEQGTGIGLWVSQGIVQKHGGNIRIFNSTDPGWTGACVEIFIPRTHTWRQSEPEIDEPPVADRIA